MQQADTYTSEASKFQPTLQGLTTEEVANSRETSGSNILTPPPRETWWSQFLSKFDDPVIRILIIAAFLAIIAGIHEGNYAEGIGIIIAILLATTLAFINEYKANQEFDILNKVNDDIPIKVIREGSYVTVPRRDIVVGDLVLVEIGDEIPADGKIIKSISFMVEESSLTGESKPVNKSAVHKPDIINDSETAYPENVLLRGTFAVDGHAVMQVTAVGDSTEIGKTARSAKEDTGEETPLNKQLARLSKVIGVVGFTTALITFLALVIRAVQMGSLNLDSNQWLVIGIIATGSTIALLKMWLPIVYDGFEVSKFEVEMPDWLDREGAMEWIKFLFFGLAFCVLAFIIAVYVGLLNTDPASWLPSSAVQIFLEYFMIAVTIIVVAVPEGLAMSVTLSLAYSMRKMTATNNLVRRMHACETIGAATVICSDKTGTLTRNVMQVVGFEIPTLPRENNSKIELLNELVVEAIAVNSTANLSRNDGVESKALGNPTESALLKWIEDYNYDYVVHRDEFEIDYQWTFSTERKLMATLGTSKNLNKEILHVKGAPELVLEKCSMINLGNGIVPLSQESRDEIIIQLKSYQDRGMRTLGFAFDDKPNGKSGKDIDHILNDIVWLGFFAISDPIREEVPNAVLSCRKAGIDIKMITGDNAETAKEIGRSIGLWDENDQEKTHHLSGRDFSELNDSEALTAVKDIKILSRARPTDKMRLVRLLQQNGEIVAVTGDGTNDAPALNYANVGLAMGKTGTSVAKEASDIILLDDSFRSIVNAVMWGRSLYENIQRFIMFQLTSNVAALVLVLVGPFIGVQIPLTVIQMLWINLIMDTFGALALATERPHEDVMHRKPRNSNSFIISPDVAKGIFSAAGMMIIVLLGILIWIKGLNPDSVLYTKSLTIFFSVFIMMLFWNLFNARCLGHNFSAFKGISDNKGFIFIAAAIFIGHITIVQFGGEVFRAVPLTLSEWALIISTTSIVLWIGEIMRLISRSRNKKINK